MPRAKRVPDSPAKLQQNHDIWAITGQTYTARLADWDPKAAEFCALVFELLSTGESVTLRPGSGGATLGIQIWTWENKRPYIWFTEHEELDQWVDELRERYKQHLAKLTE